MLRRALRITYRNGDMVRFDSFVNTPTGRYELILATRLAIRLGWRVYIE